MPSTYSTSFLMGVLPELKVTPSFLLTTFFPTMVMSDREEISFDLITRKRKLAPFVLPTSQGKVVNARGYTTKTFKPAYIKPKIAMDFSRPLKRIAGEPFGGQLSAVARRDALLMQDLEDLVAMRNARMEWMAAQALSAGSITVVGDDYPSVTVDFARDAALNVTLTGSARWAQVGSTPLIDLSNTADLIYAKSGSRPLNVVMEPTGWAVFKNHIDVKDRLTITRLANSPLDLNLNRAIETGAVLMGTIEGFNIWVYSGDYEADNGTTTPLIAANTVLVVGDIEGVQAYGAIKDNASLQAVPEFVKYWSEEDPSVDYLMLQSAPLVVPTRVNASAKITIA
jgi:hypothetical protein